MAMGIFGVNRVIAKAEVFFEKSLKIIAIGSHRIAITFIAIIMAIYHQKYDDKKNKHVPFFITINIFYVSGYFIKKYTNIYMASQVLYISKPNLTNICIPYLVVTIVTNN